MFLEYKNTLRYLIFVFHSTQFYFFFLTDMWLLFYIVCLVFLWKKKSDSMYISVKFWEVSTLGLPMEKYVAQFIDISFLYSCSIQNSFYKISNFSLWGKCLPYISVFFWKFLPTVPSKIKTSLATLYDTLMWIFFLSSFYKIVLKMAALEPVYYNVPKWIENNEQYFLPPVCNKMMHNTQLKVKKIYIFFKNYFLNHIFTGVLCWGP